MITRKEDSELVHSDPLVAQSKHYYENTDVIEGDGGLMLLKASIFSSAGIFLQYYKLIPMKLTLVLNNRNLGRFNLHWKCLRVSVMMQNYDIMI